VQYLEPCTLCSAEPPNATLSCGSFAGVDLHAGSLLLSILDHDGHSCLALRSGADGVRMSVRPWLATAETP